MAIIEQILNYSTENVQSRCRPLLFKTQTVIDHLKVAAVCLYYRRLCYVTHIDRNSSTVQYTEYAGRQSDIVDS